MKNPEVDQSDKNGVKVIYMGAWYPQGCVLLIIRDRGLGCAFTYEEDWWTKSCGTQNSQGRERREAILTVSRSMYELGSPMEMARV